MNALTRSSQTVVCILGMHRSGTSLVARAINCLGVDLGPAEELMPANRHNLRGYWERMGLSDLNEEILGSFGGDWHEPPTLTSGWHLRPELAPIRREARGLAATFSKSLVWGWKDPRNCLTLPFWQHIVSPDRYIVCLRSPAEVTLSLAERDGFSFEKSSLLWLTYTAAALVHTAGRPRVLLFYDDLLTSFEAWLAHLAEFVGLSEDSAMGEAGEMMKQTVDEGLRHHRSAFDDTADDERVPLPIRLLYAALRLHFPRCPGEGGAGDADVADNTLGVLALATEELMKDLSAGRSERQGLSSELESAQATSDGLSTELEAALAAIEKSGLALEDARRRAAELADQVGLATGQLAAASAEKSAAETALEEARQRLDTVLRSRSIRWTAPLRALAKVMRSGA